MDFQRDADGDPVKAGVVFKAGPVGVIQHQHEALAEENARLHAENAELRAALEAAHSREFARMAETRGAFLGCEGCP